MMCSSLRTGRHTAVVVSPRVGKNVVRPPVGFGRGAVVTRGRDGAARDGVAAAVDTVGPVRDGVAAAVDTVGPAAPVDTKSASGISTASTTKSAAAPDGCAPLSWIRAERPSAS